MSKPSNGSNSSGVYNYEDQKKQLRFGATRAIKVQPENVVQVDKLDKLHNSLCVPLHHSILGNKFSWSRPYSDFFNGDKKSNSYLKSTLWNCFELLILALNTRFVGTPISISPKTTPDVLKYLVAPALYLKDQHEKQLKENGIRGGIKSSRYFQEVSRKNPYDKINEWVTFSFFYSKELATIFSNIRTQYITNTINGEFPNSSLYLNFKTINIPKWETYINSDSREEEEENQQHTLTTRDNVEIPTIDSLFREHSNLEGVDSSSNSNVITEKCDYKFRVNLMKIPSSISKDINSVMLVITPNDPNFDIVQIMRYIISEFVKKDKDSLGSTSNENGPRSRAKKNENLLKSDRYGDGRPFVNDEIFNGGSFFYENQYDMEKTSTVRCPSITDTSPKNLFDALLSFLKLSEQALIHEDQMDDDEELKKRCFLFNKIIADLEKDSSIHGSTVDFDRYFDYNHPLNPNSLFTFENAMNILNYLENTDLSTSERYNAYDFFNKKTFNISDEFNSLTKTLSISNFENGFEVYNYKKPENIFWMRSVNNTVKGLCSEMFPWAETIYAIPQDVLRFAQERGKLETFNSTSSSSSYNSTSFASKVGRIFETVSKEMNGSVRKEYIYHPFAKWSSIPFDPATHTTSFIPSCHLPVAHNHITLHGACLKYRSDMLDDLKPMITSLFPEDNSFVYGNGKSVYYIQHLFNCLPQKFEFMLIKDKNLKEKWDEYCKKMSDLLDKSTKELNEYVKLKEDYNVKTTLHFSDTFMNKLATESYKLNEATESIVKHYVKCLNNHPSTITPSTYTKTNGLGEGSFLPSEDVYGIHLEDIARKFVVLAEVYGKQKLKLAIAFWAMIVLGHMDMTLPLKLHIFIGGEKSVGKSWLLSLLNRCLIPGIGQMFSTLTENSLFSSSDRSGHVLMTEEELSPLFDKKEVSSMVNFLKTLLSDGNLIKLTCDIGTGDRIVRKWTNFIRSDFIGVFNRLIQELNDAIYSRGFCATLGKTIFNTDEEESKKRRERTGTIPPVINNNNEEKWNSEKIDDMYNEMELLELEKLCKKIGIFGEDTIIPQTPTNNSQSNSVEDAGAVIQDEIIKKILSDSKGDMDFLAKNQHLETIGTEDTISFFRDSIFGTGQKSVNTENCSDEENAIVDKKYKKLLKHLGTKKTGRVGNEYKNMVSIKLLNQQGTKITRKFKTKKAFDHTNQMFRTQIEYESEKSLIEYIQFESLVNSFTHFAILEKRIAVSSHLFWCLIPKLITGVTNRYPFLSSSIDNRTIMRCERTCHNMTINKGFREEFMSPIDPYNGSYNEKHFLPFKDFYILDMAPRLFMTSSIISAGFSLICDEFINPWYNEIFNVLFTKITGYMSFLKTLMYYKNVVSKRTRPKLPTDIDDTTQSLQSNGSTCESYKYPPLLEHIKQTVETSNPEEPEYITREVLNIPAIALKTHAIPYGQKSDILGDCIFKKAKFVKFVREDSDVGTRERLSDINYVLLYECTGPNTTLQNNRRRLDSRTNENSEMSINDVVIAAFVRASTFNEKIASMGTKPFIGLLTQMLNETITANKSYEYITDEEFIEVKEMIRHNLDRGFPVDRIFLKVGIINEPRVFNVLRVVQIKPEMGTVKYQLQLCVHTVAKSQSTNFLSSLIKEIIDESSSKLITSKLFSTAGDYPGEDGELSRTYYNCNLDTANFGKDEMVYKENVDRSTKLFTIDNNDVQISKEFYMDYKTNKNTESISIGKTNVNDFNLVESFKKKMNNLSYKIQMLKLNSKKDDENTQANVDERIEKQKSRFELETARTEILEVEKEMYDLYIKRIKNDLPKKKMNIPIDLDEWAAYMHITRSNCVEIKQEESQLYYKHKKIPTSNLNNDKTKESYFETNGEWRPISSLTPHSIGRRLYKLKWNYSENGEIKSKFSEWKIKILHKLSQFITAPSLDLINEKAFVFYSKVIGAHIPKFILRDLSRLQSLNRKLNSQPSPNKIDDAMDIDIIENPSSENDNVSINEEEIEETNNYLSKMKRAKTNN